MTTTSSSPGPDTVSISPSPRLALLITLFSLSLLALPFKPWPTVVVGLFGVFLLVPTYSLRLEFPAVTLVVWRSSCCPRHTTSVSAVNSSLRL